MAKVFIGVGHGGSDPGAVANGFREKDLNMNIAYYCNEELVRHGVDTRMSRTGDEEDTLQEEIRECNAFAPDLALDIHNNAGGGDGVEAWYHYKGGLSKTLAENVLEEVQKIGQNSRGAKVKTNDAGTDWFGFIRETAAPAIIVECAFVDNAEDVQIVATEEKRKTMGYAIARGILKTLGIEYISPTVDAPAPEPTPEKGKEEDEKTDDTVESNKTPENEEVKGENKSDDEGSESDKNGENIEKEKRSFIDIIIAFLEKLISLIKGD